MMKSETLIGRSSCTFMKYLTSDGPRLRMDSGIK